MIDTKNIQEQILEVEKEFLNLFLENNFVKGEVSVCAVYDGKRLIHNPNIKDKEKYKNTFVKNFYEIKIDLSDSKVYEIGDKIEKIADNHFNQDGSCCLGLFTRTSPKSLLEFIKNYVLPFFVWHAYYKEYKMIPPWGEWSHGEEGIRQFNKNLKNISRNNICPCGSGKKYKKCCLK